MVTGFAASADNSDANNNTEELNSNNYDCLLGLFLFLPPYKLHVVFQKCEKNKNKHCQTNQYGWKVELNWLCQHQIQEPENSNKNWESTLTCAGLKPKMGKWHFN